MPAGVCTATNKATTHKLFFLKARPEMAQKQTEDEGVNPFWARRALSGSALGHYKVHHCVLTHLSCDTADVSPSADAHLSAAIYRFLTL